MARMGTFAGSSEAYGDVVSYIHPKDNDFEKARFHPILLDPRLKLTLKQRRNLQRQIDDLAGLGRIAREKAIARILRNEKKTPAKKPQQKKKKKR